MKLSNIKYGILAVLAIAFASCEEEGRVVLNSTAAIEPTASDDDIVLVKEMAGTDVLTISWPEPDYGFSASATYTIYLDKTGDFTEAAVVGTGSNTTKTFKAEELNGILANLDFEAEQEGVVNVRVESRLSNDQKILSEPFTLTVTPYLAFLDLSTPWGIVGSGYNNWGQFPDAPFYTTSTPNVLVAYVKLLSGAIKFRQNNDWEVNVGDTGDDGTTEAGGADIAVVAGTYKITFNPVANTYTKVLYTWGIVGSAYNNWGADGPDFPFDYDDSSDKWRAIVKLQAGAMKIRKNNDWGLNYGDTGADGTLEEGGADIAVPAGKYQITFDEKNLLVEIIPIDHIWGLVGSAYNDWGAAGLDAAFTRDWREDNVWVLKDKYVTLLAGAFKFRDGNDWALNYGDTDANGSLEASGSDIVSTANVYSIRLDFNNEASPTWSFVKY
jgi:hypothetical protein